MPLLIAASIVAAGASFACTPTKVWDGDGPVWCAEGPHVRLAGIAAREMDGMCRANQPCPDASAIEARDALVGLLGGARGIASEGHVLVAGPSLTCVSEGAAGGTRTAAWCVTAGGLDLSCAMVATGTVLRWDRYWRQHRCRWLSNRSDPRGPSDLPAVGRNESREHPDERSSSPNRVGIGAASIGCSMALGTVSLNAGWLE